jgi:hypothetical protein
MGHFCGPNLPPAAMLHHPGPGVDGPGPGVMIPGPLPPPPPQTSQVAFVGPDGVQVSWDVTGPGRFDSEPLFAPGRFNFIQGAIYRLKLTAVPGRPGLELYPTLEIAPTMPRTEAYLAHNPIPVQFTEEDFGQVVSGNFVTKVIYLPDAEFQDLAIAGVETLVSTRLDPGVDPIVEADRQGSIMAIVRIGNIDLQAGGMPLGLPPGIQPVSYNQPMPGDPAAAGDPAMMGPQGAFVGPDGMMVAPQGVPSYAYGGGMPAFMPPSALPPGYVSGVTVPEYGMPMVGTPIGLPGPPHIPLGGPAGLQAHIMRNNTRVRLPAPVDTVRINARQVPGISYPRPADTLNIRERVVTEQGGREMDPHMSHHHQADCP